MTNKEKLEKAYELIDEANKLIDEVANSEPEIEPEDPVAEYRERLESDKRAYYINLGGVSHAYPDEFNENDYNPYFRFLDARYADEAAKMYKLICMQLAFKWCHDRDFKPDWENINEGKYFICFDSDDSKFLVQCVSHTQSNAVYFSNARTAQKCADWLKSQLGGA